jgi:PilZ domain
MPAKSTEASTRQTVDHQAVLATTHPIERRKRTRSHVHWRVCFWGGLLTEAIETFTRDLSSDGFYCLSKVPFVPGERLACSIKIPGYQGTGSTLESELECRVQVIRTEAANVDGYFGMGCRIEDYRVTPRPPEGLKILGA